MSVAERFYEDRDLHVRKLYAGGTLMSQPAPVRGRDWFVDGNRGSNVAAGDGWDDPILTMERVFENGLGSGDRIYFTGNIAEQLQIPDGVFDVTVIGAGNRPRHPDAHTGNGGYTSARWKLPTSPVSATPCLKVTNQGWRFVNFLWTADTSQVCVDLITNSESGDDEYSAGHAEFIGMRFDGPGIGIRDNGPAGFVGIERCFFRGMTTAIASIAGAGPGTRSWWEIRGNRFESNTNHVVLGLDRSLITRNYFMDFTTKALDISGGSVGKNMVVRNYMMGDYDAGYVAGANDMWQGNVALDTTSGEVEDGTGFTTAVPAA